VPGTVIIDRAEAAGSVAAGSAATGSLDAAIFFAADGLAAFFGAAYFLAGFFADFLAGFLAVFPVAFSSSLCGCFSSELACGYFPCRSSLPGNLLLGGLLGRFLGGFFRGFLCSFFLRSHLKLLRWMNRQVENETRETKPLGLFIGARRCSVAAAPPEMRLIRISELSAERAAH